MLTHEQKSYFMHKAYELAKINLGFCMPNPSVGAVIVENNTIIAEGFHKGSGTAHAEPCAIHKIPNDLSDSILFVTLEPCCIFGKTPPCTDLIIKRGIKHVIFGHYDANPKVSGKGAETLIATGVECEYFPIPEIADLYKAYDYWHQFKRPYVTAKLALSLDGKISLNQLKPTQISSKGLNQITHIYRKEVCAILSTNKTVNADNPYFNARINKMSYAKNLYILDRTLSVNLNANIFSSAKNITIFHGHDAELKKIVSLTNKNICCVAVNEKDGKLDLAEIIHKIGAYGVQHLWVEAGAQLFASLSQSRLIAKALLYYSPQILGTKAYAGLIDPSTLVDVKRTHWELVEQEAICHLSWH